MLFHEKRRLALVLIKFVFLFLKKCCKFFPIILRTGQNSIGRLTINLRSFLSCSVLSEIPDLHYSQTHGGASGSEFFEKTKQVVEYTYLSDFCSIWGNRGSWDILGNSHRRSGPPPLSSLSQHIHRNCTFKCHKLY